MGALKLIDQQIMEYLPRLNTRQKKAVLDVVKTFATEQQDWWDEIGREQQEAIDKALSEMKAGKLTPHDKVISNTGTSMNSKSSR
jgi:ABC-type cobalamin/Fe3+-siderophores transport system ATPase subunit